MDWPHYIQQRLPNVIRGVAGIVASRIAVPSEIEDPTPKFIEKRIALISKYQEELAEEKKNKAFSGDARSCCRMSLLSVGGVSRCGEEPSALRSTGVQRGQNGTGYRRHDSQSQSNA